tara:strand:- start:887 stop:1627 length:741 start_codon:yes stop_codon:yes gene_type:complete
MTNLFKDKKETSINYLPEQIKDIQDTNKFKRDVTMPAYKDYTDDVRRTYNESREGMARAGQQLGGYAGQVGQTLGETGESAARTGVAGLSQFFDPKYGQEQFAAAMNPIQSQYMSNLANQGAQFGGAGNLGSSRQALAQSNAAAANQSAQMQAAAGVMNNLNNQRLQAGQSLGQLGGNYLNQGLNAMSTKLGAAERPMDQIGQVGKNLSYVPGAMYTPQYPGQLGTTSESRDSPLGIVGKIFGGFK